MGLQDLECLETHRWLVPDRIGPQHKAQPVFIKHQNNCGTSCDQKCVLFIFFAGTRPKGTKTCQKKNRTVQRHCPFLVTRFLFRDFNLFFVCFVFSHFVHFSSIFKIFICLFNLFLFVCFSLWLPQRPTCDVVKPTGMDCLNARPVSQTLGLPNALWDVNNKHVPKNEKWKLDHETCEPEPTTRLNLKNVTHDE